MAEDIETPALSSNRRESHETTDKQTQTGHKHQFPDFFNWRCLPTGLKREGRLFVKVTAMHGVRRWWETRGHIQKTFWFIAILICFGIMVVLIALNIKEFVNDNGSTQVNHTMDANGKKLPKVTFCNNYPIRKGHVQMKYGEMSEKLRRYVILSNRDPSMIGNNNFAGIDSEFEDYKKKHTGFTLRKFFEDTGSTCEEVFKSCSFAGKNFKCCDKTRFNTTLTEMGLCHSITINDEYQTSETENGGLQLILDAHTDDYLPFEIDTNQIFNYPLSEGFRIFLEESEMHTYRSAHGISVAPGQSIFSGIQLNQYMLATKCRSDWEGVNLKGYNTVLKYQARDCRSKCLSKVYDRICKCAPLVYDIDSEYTNCSPKQIFECSRREEVQKAASLEEETECDFCKVECDRYDYQSYNSYGGPLSKSAVDALHTHFASVTNETIKQFVVVTIYYRELSSIMYNAVKSPSFGELLSNIGGSAGLCLGFSALTFIEIIVLFFKAISYIFRKKDLDKKGVEYKENKRLEQAAIDSLKEKHKKKHSGAGDAGGDPNGPSPPGHSSSPVAIPPRGDTAHLGLATNLTARGQANLRRAPSAPETNATQTTGTEGGGDAPNGENMNSTPPARLDV
ncbi:hypothetical protein PRIPAC_72868 [Pristionchus pacificus]|nr:hypothetical protein PRIPAC_72868 [Pristionchus pacificus]